MTEQASKEGATAFDTDRSGRSRWPNLQEFDWQAARPWFADSEYRSEPVGERYEPRNREQIDRDRLLAWIRRWRFTPRVE